MASSSPHRSASRRRCGWRAIIGQVGYSWAPRGRQGGSRRMPQHTSVADASERADRAAARKREGGEGWWDIISTGVRLCCSRQATRSNGNGGPSHCIRLRRRHTRWGQVVPCSPRRSGRVHWLAGETATETACGSSESSLHPRRARSSLSRCRRRCVCLPSDLTTLAFLACPPCLSRSRCCRDETRPARRSDQRPGRSSGVSVTPRL